MSGQPRLVIVGKTEAHFEKADFGQIGECGNQFRIKFDRFLQKRTGLFQIFFRAFIQMSAAVLQHVPGVQIIGLVHPGAVPLCLGELGLDCADHGLGQFILQIEDIFKLAVIPFGPQMVAGGAVDQLGR